MYYACLTKIRVIIFLMYHVLCMLNKDTCNFLMYQVLCILNKNTRTKFGYVIMYDVYLARIHVLASFMYHV